LKKQAERLFHQPAVAFGYGVAPHGISNIQGKSRFSGLVRLEIPCLPCVAENGWSLGVFLKDLSVNHLA